MSAATDAVNQAQAQLAAAQAAAAQEAEQTKTEGDSEAAVAAEAALGKGIGGYMGDLIRRVESLESKVFHSGSQSPAAESDTPQEATQE